MSSVVLQCLVAIHLLLAPGAPAAPAPQDEEAPQTEQQEAPGMEASAESQAEAVAEDDDDGWDALDEDPCSIGADGNWIDKMNEKVTKSVCGSARWFDHFFGTARGDIDRDATFGRVGLGVLWDEEDGAEMDGRFRVKIHFPNMDDRFSAIVGRGSTDEVLDEQGPGLPPAGGFLDADAELLVGFGYHVLKSDHNKLTLSLGTSWSDSSLDPYVRLRYLYNRPLSESSHFRFRLVPQWQESKGVGATAKVGVDRSLGDGMLLRWEIHGRGFENRFDGLAYSANIQLFQSIGARRAMRYLVGVWGQSGFEHQPEDWGVQITFRDSLYKDLLFIEVLGGVNFRRRAGDPGREAEMLAGLFFELMFGK